jgi:hypothetical protein
VLRLPEEGGTIARDSAAGTVRPGDVLVAVGLNVQTVDGATYNQDVFAAVGPVTCAATPNVGRHRVRRDLHQGRRIHCRVCDVPRRRHRVHHDLEPPRHWKGKWDARKVALASMLKAAVTAVTTATSEE